MGRYLGRDVRMEKTDFEQTVAEILGGLSP